jgi:hypothetical protein
MLPFELVAVFHESRDLVDGKIERRPVFDSLLQFA